MDRIGRFFLDRPIWVTALVLLALVALPVAVWLDLYNLSEQNLRTQAASLNRVISIVRTYYATNVVARVLSAKGRTQPLHSYREVPGAIPIPATLSIELGEALSADLGDVAFRFVSDFPFVGRRPHDLDPFERRALQEFRKPGGAERFLVDSTGTVFDQRITLATPVVMSEACVACHNSHPGSPKWDWGVGDVRGIQTVSIHQPIALNLWSFKWLLAYLAVAGTIGLLFAVLQFRLASSFQGLNAELEANNSFLTDISGKISKYLSPQIYRSIFSGEKDVTIATERKKLTIFFSDIKDFTATTERMQPEELTQLLNEYFTEMSRIAEAHGATIDKFIGDAIVAFFGDPETKGVVEDARACVRMAIDMQRRLVELNKAWHDRGVEHPFRARIGINTGYCNVGNFGSEQRMDYTIIGAEANLAARLEGIAQPGGIVMSYETWSHVRDVIEARPIAPTRFKGIAREVIPYEVELPEGSTEPGRVIEETAPGVKIMVNLDALDEEGRRKAREALRRALEGVEGKA